MSNDTNVDQTCHRYVDDHPDLTNEPYIMLIFAVLYGASVLVSTFSLSAIALDRYNLVVRPHRHPLRSRGATVVAVSLWVISVVVCMPYGWYMDVVQISGLCGEFCTEKWPLPEIRKGYALMVLMMQFILPFATMAVCYYTIFSRLQERAESKLRKLTERTQLLESAAGNSSPTEKKENVSHQLSFDERRRLSVLASQRRTTTILASMVLLFGFTWLPHNVYTLIIEYNEAFFNNGERDNTYMVSMIAHFISMTTNVANPILYAWLNPSFKEMLLTSIRRKSRMQNKFNVKPSILDINKASNTLEKLTEYNCSKCVQSPLSVRNLASLQDANL
ncbi:7 transmembrane receptor [Dictyocaulus viviparus]|uniref:7 transmembrane receptor n=1 Tax=Dictyocaulus viviparus TaxID=29172 RepID=A0A0D8XZ10_DICVI|nr:7 transmembrane receptor [Dictyocaulus viviparus]